MTNGLETGVSWLWGPPGTGKTTTLATLIEQLRIAGRRALVVSNTNAAVDAALGSYLRVVGHSTPASAGEVIRIGMSADASLVDARPHPVLLADELARQGEPLAQQRREVEAALRSRRTERTRLGRDADKLQRERQALRDEAKSAARLQREIDEIQRTAQRRSEACLFERAKCASGPPSASQARAIRLTEGRIERDLRSIQGLEEKLAGLQQAINAHADRESALSQRAKDIASRQSRVIAAIADRQAQLRNVADALKALEKAIIARASIVFATVHQCYLASLRDERFNCVVIDEASMVSLPLAMLAAGLGSGHTVFAGDFRQLSPICQSEKPSTRRWLGRSAFDAAGVPQLIAGGHTVQRLSVLSVQHRMKNKICSLVSESYYPERGLIASAGVLARPVPASVADALPDDVTVVDTSGLRPWVARPGSLRSRFNPIHALVVKAALSAIDGSSTTLGLIAPYAPQARALDAITKDVGYGTAATVHRFQGGEKDVIVYDTTEGYGVGVGPWFTKGALDTEGARLMNVAFSRARDRLVVVMNMDRLLPKIGGDATVRAFDFLKGRASRVDARELLDRSSAIDLAEGPEGFARVLTALETARCAVRLWTCGLGAGTSAVRAVDLLCERAEEGVRVTVTCPPPSDSRVRGLQEQLLDAGVQVDLIQHDTKENLMVADDVCIVSPHALLEVRKDGRWLVSRGSDSAGTMTQLLARDWRQRDADGPCRRCGRAKGRHESWNKRVSYFCMWCSGASANMRPASALPAEATMAGSTGFPAHSWLYDEVG